MKKSIIFFAALAALFSCTKENPVVETPAEETFSVELFASAPAPADTKTTLVDGGVDAEGKPIKFVHWSKGDAIKVLFFPDRTQSNTFNGPVSEFQSDFETETSEKAYFKTNSWSWGFGSDVVSSRLMATGIAVYPSTAEATSNKTQSGSAANNTELSFTLPDAQKAINGNIESGLNFSYAMVGRDGFKSAVDNKSAMNLKFNNACALIQLTMPSEFEKEVTSITLSSNNEVALTGKGNVDMNFYKDEILSPFHVTPEVTETSHTVTLAKADGSALEAGATYFAVVWPGKHEGLTISFNAADGTIATLTTKTVELKAAVVKPYNILSTLDFVSAQRDYKYYYANGEMGDDTNPKGTSVVGVIIYHGNPKTEFNDSQLPDQYCNGLAISVSSRKCAWNSSSITIPSSVKVYGATGAIADFSMGGYTATQAFGSNNYTVFANGTAPSGTSGWYLGAAKEWKYILSNMDKINKLLEGVGDAINPYQKSEAFWLPYFYSTKAAIVYISVGAPYFYYEQYYYHPTNPNCCYNVRPIFAF